MKVFYSDDFTGKWPSGVAAVVVASDRRQAKRLLRKALKERGLEFDGSIKGIDTTNPNVVVIDDGEY